MNFNDAAIDFLKGGDYRIHFWCMSNNDAISIMNNSNLNGKMDVLSFFLLYIKMGEKIYYQWNRDMILNRAKD